MSLVCEVEATKDEGLSLEGFGDSFSFVSDLPSVAVAEEDEVVEAPSFASRRARICSAGGSVGSGSCSSGPILMLFGKAAEFGKVGSVVIRSAVGSLAIQELLMGRRLWQIYAGFCRMMIKLMAACKRLSDVLEPLL